MYKLMKLSLVTVGCCGILAACNKTKTQAVSVLKQPVPQMQQVEQEINPILPTREFNQNLPSKLTTIQPKGAYPEILDRRYLEIKITHNHSISQYNGVQTPNGTREISIWAKKLVLDQKDTQKIRQLINNQTDITRVTLTAEQIELNSSLKLPGVELTINADSLTVAAHAQINTSATEHTLLPKQFANGKAGRSAGNITLNVAKLNLAPRVIPFIVAKGANGQAGGVGQDGADGISVPTIQGSDSIVYQKKVKRSCNFEFGHRHCNDQTIILGVNRWPTSGEDAKRGGIPGIGGNGGNLFTTCAIDNSFVELAGGKMGKLPPIAKGGKSGTPNKAIHDIFGNQQIQTTTKGLDAAVEIKENRDGQDGTISLISIDSPWRDQKLIELLERYAKDLYKANYIADADRAFNQLYAKTKSLTTTKYLYQIKNHLDFYGHSITWTPTLALGANFKHFTSDKQTLLRTLYLTYWIKNSNAELDAKINATETLITEKQKHIVELQQSLNGITTQLPNLKTAVAKLSYEQQQLQSELERLEEEIKQEAIDDLKPSGALKAIRALGAITAVIPAGQPALGAIGNGMVAITNAIESDEPLSNMFNTSMNIYSSLQGDTLSRSLINWKNKWQELDPREWSNMSGKEQISLLKKAIDFATPIKGELDKQMSILGSKEVPQSALEQKIAEIKQQHSEYKEITNRVNHLIAKKAELNRQIRSFTHQYSTLALNLEEESKESIELQQSLNRLAEGNSDSLYTTVNKLENRTKEQLDYYFYLLKKSFEYRFLKPYLAEFDYSKLIDQFRRLIKANKDSDLSMQEFNTILAIYDTALLEYKSAVKEELLKSERLEDDHFYLELSSDELERLNKEGNVELVVNEERLFSTVMQKFSDVRVKEISLKTVSTDSEQQMQIVIERVGNAFIAKNNHYYAFESSRNNRWTFQNDRYDLNDFYQVRSAQSEMDTLFDLFGDSYQLFSLTGALGRYKISVKQSSKQTINIEQLVFNLNCEYN